MGTLIAVDIGNTNVTVGGVDADRVVARWAYATDSKKTEDEHELLLAGLFAARGVKLGDVDATVMCSVVPHQL